MEYVQKTQDGCQALWDWQAPVQAHLCLPSDYLVVAESTRAATTPITVSKT